MENRHIMQLNRAYRKNFKLLSKKYLKNKDIGIVFFVEYLKYLRDSLTIKASNSLKKTVLKEKITTLTTAIAEYEAYQKSKDSSQKSFHWNNFCEFVKLNMEEWLKINDSI